MKRKGLFYLLAMTLTLIFSSFLFTACDDEDAQDADAPRDELSNTTWKLVSISGWGAGDSDDWRGTIFVFEPDGFVTEKYVEDGSESGSYTLTNGNIKFFGIDYWISTWGSTFSYVISGDTMILKDDLGSMGSTFNFTKL